MLAEMNWRTFPLVATFCVTLIVCESANLDLCQEQVTADAMLVALLPLHGGSSCDQVQLKAVQQLAAMQIALKQINDLEKNEGLTLDLHVMDTCSDAKQTIRMGFKALIFSDATLCKKSSPFLGFLGPDNGEELVAVQKVTSVFHLSHVNPLSLPAYNLEAANNFYVEVVNIGDQVNAILHLLDRLHWTAVSIVHSSDAESTLLANSLHIAGIRSGICIAAKQLLPEDGGNGPTLLTQIPTAGVLAVGRSSRLAELLSLSLHSSEPHSFIFVAHDVGTLPPLALTESTGHPILVLQQVGFPLPGLAKQLAKSPIWDEYLYQQRCNFSSCRNTDGHAESFAAVPDPSVVPITHAIRLFAKVLRTTQKNHCATRLGRCPALKNLSAENWRDLLRNVTDKGIRFDMSHFPKYELYYKVPFSPTLQMVGNISGSNSDMQMEPVEFPESHDALCKPEMPKGNGYPSVPTTHFPILSGDSKVRNQNDDGESTTSIAGTETPSRGIFSFEIFRLQHFTTIEIIGIMIGVACSIGITFALLIYIVYSAFKVKSNEESRRGGSKSSRRSSVRSV